MDRVSYAVTAFWFLASMTFFVNFKNLENSHQIRVKTYEAIAQAHEIVINVAEAESFQRNYVLIGNQDYLDQFLTSEVKIFSSIDKLKKITADNKSQLIKLVEDIAKYRLLVWHETIDDYKKSGFEAAKKHIVDTYKISGTVKMGELKKALADVIAEEEKLLLIREQKNDHDFENSRNCIYAAFFISIGIFLFPLVNLLRKQ